MKRKHESKGSEANGHATKKTSKKQDKNVHSNFRDDLFEKKVLSGYVKEYKNSAPFVSCHMITNGNNADSMDKDTNMLLSTL